jgi:O-antigen ligase
MFKDKPAFGHGPKSFYKKCMEEKYNQTNAGCTTHPHNFYIQLLAETGIFGFSFLISTLFYFIYLIVKSFYFYFKLNRNFFSDYQICLLGGLLITIWPFSPNGNFFNNNLMILYGLQMGFFNRNIIRNE